MITLVLPFKNILKPLVCYKLKLSLKGKLFTQRFLLSTSYEEEIKKIHMPLKSFDKNYILFIYLIFVDFLVTCKISMYDLRKGREIYIDTIFLRWW